MTSFYIIPKYVYLQIFSIVDTWTDLYSKLYNTTYTRSSKILLQWLIKIKCIKNKLL